MTVGERIAERMALMGVSQAWLAQRVGITQPSVNSILRRPGAGTKHLHRIAKALQTSVAYLVGETDDPEAELPPLSIETTKKMIGIVHIRSVGDRFGLGGEFQDEADGHVQDIAFPKAWLGRPGASPADFLLFTGAGDSMMPTISHDDQVLIDTGQRAVRQQDVIWALRYGDIGMIKRVRRLPGARFQLNSDNPNVAPLELAEGEFDVVGRVTWVGRRV